MIRRIFASLIIVVAVATLACLTADAKPLSEVALFQRCYVHLTGHPVPLNDSRIEQIRSGSTSALQACYAVLDNARLQDSGRPKNESSESRQVLKQFFNLHRSWFSANTQEQAAGFSADYVNTSSDVYDFSAPSLMITYYALRDQAKYSDLMRGTTPIEAVRQEDPAIRARIGWNTSSPSRYKYGNNDFFRPNDFVFRPQGERYANFNPNFPDPIFIFLDGGSARNPNANSIVMTAPMPQVGELIGLRPSTRSFVPPNFTLDPGTDYSRDRNAAKLPIENSRNMFEGFGGGIIGNPEFFLLNAGHPSGTLFNGTTKLPRRWAQAVENTFLCVDTAQRKPLREKDIDSYLITQGNVSAAELAQFANVAPFRQSKSCLQCHASFDPMASTARNLVLGASDVLQPLYMPSNLSQYYKTTIVLGRLTVDNSIQLPHEWLTVPIDTDPANPRYSRTSPTGRLRYRSSNGELIDVPVSNMEDLGQAISQQNDYYRCAAKRYFQYLTGFDINLFDRRDPANAALDAQMDDAAIAHRDLIDQMAAELKSSQSIPNMLKVILRSNIYRDSNYAGVSK